MQCHVGEWNSASSRGVHTISTGCGFNRALALAAPGNIYPTEYPEHIGCAHFAGWLAYQVARLSMMALLYGKLILCMVELSRLPSRYALKAMIR